MSILWHDAAVRELEEAALYFGGVDEELGQRFVSAAEVAVAWIKARPGLARKFDGEARKVRMRRFPYAVIYGMNDGVPHILAVMHLHREPGYWRDRVK